MHNKQNEHSNISIVDAVETLSNIADLDLERDVGIAQQHKIVVQGQNISYQTVHWLRQQDAGKAVHFVKEIFRTILNYLKDFYEKQYGALTDEKTIEGIKTIMVLVGEAAKKLDKYTNLFQHSHSPSVTDIKEYRQLQDLYLNRIAHKIDEGMLGKWILALSQKAFMQKKPVKLVGKKIETKHIFVDLESIKKDTEYELLFLRKEDGTRFFSPRLIRNIKLICDFGSYFKEAKKEDPLVDIGIWQDQCIQASARNLLRSLKGSVDHFYQETKKYKDHELVQAINKTLMALLMSSHPSNLLKNDPIKCCSEYFIDFQQFLNEALLCREYQKLIAYPPKKSNQFSLCLLDTIHALCCNFFVNLQGLQSILPHIQALIQEAEEAISTEHLAAAKASKTLWSKIAADYKAMIKLFKHHPNGPLKKVLDMLENGNYHFFDPIRQNNIPDQLFSLHINENKITNIRLPAPVNQEFIHKVHIKEEFKDFLRSMENNLVFKKHLMFNLQDKTSWREHFRSTALEDLQRFPEFSKNLAVITLAKDSEFYHQLAPYHEDNHADVFIKHFKEHLQDESCGFYFPTSIKKKLFPEFANHVIEAVHRIFFSSKNVLLRENRLDFIEIVYLFLQLKAIEIVQPDTFSFTCKDGLDIGCASSAQLFVFLKLLNEEALNEKEQESLNLILYGPSILLRERVMIAERFNRMLSVIKTIESVRNELGYAKFSKIVNEGFRKLFKIPILQCAITFPKLT